MSSTSELGHYVVTNGNLDADEPMSAATARWILNNSRHLIDEATQTRVNWVALALEGTPAGGGYEDEGLKWYGSATSNWFHCLTFIFPVSSIGSDAYSNSYASPVNLVISVAGYTESSEELFIRAVIQPYYRNRVGDFDDERVLAAFDGSTTSNTPEWIIDSVTTGEYPDNITNISGTSPFTFTEYDSVERTVRLRLFRLTIYASEGKQYGYGHITGVYVREFQGIPGAAPA